jgi:sugar fermentation stimulation protein A
MNHYRETDMQLFRPVHRAEFLARPNRFTVICNLRGTITKAFLPNPGRLWELLLPGATLYLEEAHAPHRKLPYTAVAVLRDGDPVVLHTHRTNDIAHMLIERGSVPGLEDARVIRREIREGRSRFDFLLSRGGEEILLEVKSCTLFSRRVAMFPDAVTTRGKRHIEELAALSGKNRRGALLFVIHSLRAEVFMPDYHTDLDLTKALLAARNRIRVLPLAVQVGEDLSITSKVRLLPVPWEIVEREAKDRGSYLLILRVRKRTTREIGSLGAVTFRPGYYIYVGSARKGLSKRIERHRRLRKRLFWHIDFLRAAAEFHAALPIRTEDDLECELARRLRKLAVWDVPRFGSSDCACRSHLFGMKTDPLQTTDLHAFLQYVRMDRLVGERHR